MIPGAGRARDGAPPPRAPRRTGPARLRAFLLPAAILAVLAGFALRLPAEEAAPPLRPDGELVSGALRSGLSYYLRPTSRPEDRLVFRLVVAAGSDREAAGEFGLAHFVEHMAFNGTAAYPGNALDDLMAAVDEGLDLEVNAFTYPDCTVYHLEIPADRDDALDLGFGILRQWASETLFEPREVDLERGVILAEMREYDTPEDRLSRLEEEALYGEPPSRGLGILGDPASVLGAAPEALRAFYRREYLPERMAAVLAGPFDVREARRAFERAFQGFGGRASPVRAPGRSGFEGAEGLRTVRSEDGRRGRTELRLLFREPPGSLRTKAGWAREYRARLAARVLAGRLEDLGKGPEVPWVFVGAERRDERGGERLWDVAVSCPPGAEAAALKSLGRELGALQAFGGDRAEAETAAREAGLTLPFPDPDAYDAVDASVRAFLYGEYLPDPASADDLEAWLRQSASAEGAPPPGAGRGDMPSPGAGVLSVVRPGPGGPSPGELSAAYLGGLCLGRSEGSALRKDARGDGSGAPRESAGAARPPESRRQLPDGTVELVLANGLRVRIRATGSGEGWAYLAAWSPGGLAAAPASLRAAADEAPALLGLAGYPEDSPSALRSALAGSWAAWRADVASREELVEADGGAEDLELLFRLTADSFRSPSAAPEAVRKAEAARAEELRRSGGAEAEFRYRSESRLSGPLARIDPGVLEDWTPEAVRAAWADRFGDPGDFEFLAVGDFDPREAERLAAEYLGSLAAGARREPVPAPPKPSPGRLVLPSAGAPRGRVLAAWAPRGLDAGEMAGMAALTRPLEERLSRRLREELAETYGVYCTWTPFPELPGSGEFRIEFEAAPDRASALADELLRGIAGFASEAAAAPEPSGSGSPIPENDEEVYLRLLDGLRAERAERAGGAAAAGARPPEAFSASDMPDLAARHLAPEAASVFVLASR